MTECIGAEVRALRGLLGLDSGYASRVLRSLDQKGLVLVRSSPDRRVRRAYLTEAGLAERAELDRRSDVLALRILEPLSVRQRATLVAAVSNTLPNSTPASRPASILHSAFWRRQTN